MPVEVYANLLWRKNTFKHKPQIIPTISFREYDFSKTKNKCIRHTRKEVRLLESTETNYRTRYSQTANIENAITEY